jgi:osmoprotectant transport system ATP-binding protein
VIVLEHVCKHFVSRGRTVRAVDDVSLEVRAGELCVLIGPSGSGKTTTMRLVNRLEAPSAGRIRVAGRDIDTVDPVHLRRSIGYVIQQIGLLPHLTVADNVALVPRLSGWPPARRRRRAEELLDLVGLPPQEFARRYPRELSGGQQQRVGVARALAADPPIVLMDEPFGAVDPITRKQLQRELRRIQAEVRKTIIFVTHDVAEAFLLGDRIVVMSDGRIVQDGVPADLLRRPASVFVTDFIGGDRALLALRHTRLAELAKPAGEPAGGPHDPAAIPALPGSLSVLDALGDIAARRHADGQGVWVRDEEAGQARFLPYADLVEAISRAVAVDAPGGREAGREA